MNKLLVIELFNIYKSLFTQRQCEIADAYYNYDLSLGEIAQSLGISRQAVSDTLIKLADSLNDYESKLKLQYIRNQLILAQSQADKGQAIEQILNSIN